MHVRGPYISQSSAPMAGMRAKQRLSVMVVAGTVPQYRRTNLVQLRYPRS